MARKKKTSPPRGRGRPATGKAPLRSFRITDDDYALMRRAAELEGKPVSEWLREVALRAARRAMKGEK